MESRRGFSYGESRRSSYGESRGTSYGESRGTSYERLISSSSQEKFTNPDSVSNGNISNSRIEELRAQLLQLRTEIEIETERQELERQEEERLLQQIKESQEELKNLRKSR